MVFPVVLVKLTEWLLLYQLLANSCYTAAAKMKNCVFLLKNPFALFKPPSPSSQSQTHLLFPSVTKCDLENRGFDTLVCDIHGVLLKTQSFFPFFMLVAFEAGGIFRSLLLLLSYPFLWLLDYELKIRVMTFISFCGLKVKNVENVSRAVLPKFYLENLNVQAYDVWVSTGSRVVFTSLPKVMVECFLKEYMSVDGVMGTELHRFGQYYSGLVSGSGMLVKHKALKDYFGDKKPEVGLGGSSLHDHLFISLCKEGYVMNKEESKNNTSSMTLPKERYPKPLIFHDGRLAFLPTPLSTLTMFLWFPLGLFLSIFRLSIGIILPYKISFLLGACSGMRVRVKSNTNFLIQKKTHKNKGVLYVCNHRTLIDPVFLSLALEKPLTAVTYSLSKVSEVISPIKTVRLRRDRNKDGEAMQKLLSEGDLVVCPEGTTCREPYLLRFSSLFAELAEEIVPVAMNTEVSMFYGTTASGLKCLDPIFFLMNPRPLYSVEVLEKLKKEETCGGGRSSFEVANLIQKKLACALGFQCTNLTRRDKYLMLAGNEGIVDDDK